jgi:hypothetical protein
MQELFLKWRNFKVTSSVILETNKPGKTDQDINPIVVCNDEVFRIKTFCFWAAVSYHKLATALRERKI